MPTLQDLLEEMRKTGMDMGKIAARARDSGFIDERMLAILQHRVPLPPAHRLEPAKIGKRLGIAPYLVRELEALAYGVMCHYVRNRDNPDKINTLKLSLEQLPWPDGYWGTATVNAISAYFRVTYDYGRRPTVSETLVRFEILANEDRRFAARMFGEVRLATTYRTFTAAGIQLPRIRTRYNA
ncbi:hypothetical protein HY637_04700 [Candidatus Woesearchaeota archaeon]|nr:hypothetical protein [Candidatus Woesearchaeota archaeon]